MDRFHYKVTFKNGKTVRGWEAAESSEELLDRLCKKHDEGVSFYVEFDQEEDDDFISSC